MTNLQSIEAWNFGTCFLFTKKRWKLIVRSTQQNLKKKHFLFCKKQVEPLLIFLSIFFNFINFSFIYNTIKTITWPFRRTTRISTSVIFRHLKIYSKIWTESLIWTVRLNHIINRRIFMFFKQEQLRNWFTEWILWRSVSREPKSYCTTW